VLDDEVAQIRTKPPDIGIWHFSQTTAAITVRTMVAY
jgi:hypothetical protein